MFERFTDRARQAIVRAQEEARQLNHGWIGTEHLLLGLIGVGEGVAGEALATLGISLDDVRREVEAFVARGTEQPSGHLPLTPRSKKVLELAVREAQQLNPAGWVGTGHILLSLIREGDGVAAHVLVRLGADLDLARQQVIRLLSSRPREVPPTAGSAFREGKNTIAAKETEQEADGGEIRLLHAEIERLRALLRAHDVDPGIGYGDWPRT